MLTLILMVVAFVCFLVAAVLAGRANLWGLLVAAGLAVWVLAVMLATHPL